MAEPLLSALTLSLIVATINAMNSLNSASSGVLIQYEAEIFVIAIIANFIKGIISPAIAGISAIGMLLDILLFAPTISAIAPGALLV